MRVTLLSFFFFFFLWKFSKKIPEWNEGKIARFALAIGGGTLKYTRPQIKRYDAIYAYSRARRRNE